MLALISSRVAWPAVASSPGETRSATITTRFLAGLRQSAMLETAKYFIVCVGALLMLIRILYVRALPRVLPGIPHNEESAKRILGDLPHLAALKRAGKRPRTFWSQLARRHNSPITQLFMGPLSGPSVVVADFREAHDLLLRRSRDLDLGSHQCDGWRGALPEHFVAMSSSDPRFKRSRDLVRDLMTPSVLHKINAPEIYDKVTRFVHLWRFKAQTANGLPFPAFQDIDILTSDIIMAAALGIDESHCETTKALRELQSANLAPATIKNPSEKTYNFPKFLRSEPVQAIMTIAEAVGQSFMTLSPRAYHLVNNLRPSIRRAHRVRETFLRSHVDRACRRHAAAGAAFQPRSAVDYMVARELAAARKEGRAADFGLQVFVDELFGYLLAGQDTVQSVLAWLVKQLGARPAFQAEIRAGLGRAFPEAQAEGRQPLAPEILRAHVPYLDAFVEEALRTFAPSSILSRIAKCDMVVLGHHIPRGTCLWFPAMGPSITEPGFDIPEEARSASSQKYAPGAREAPCGGPYPLDEFRPERWLRHEPGAGDGQPPTTVFDPKAAPMLAFSGGPRACWGRRLAYMELKMVVALLLWNFTFLPIPDEIDSWDMYEVFLLKPKTCLVRLEEVQHGG